MKSADAEHINRVAETAFRYYRTDYHTPQAFEELLTLVYPRVVAMLRYGYGIASPDAQDDLFQDIVVRFLKHNHHYKLDQPFLCWFYAMVRNVAKDSHKSYLRRRRYEDSENEFVVVSHCAAQEESKLREQRAVMASALNRLAKNDQEILWLFYYEGFTEEELAATLNASPSNVKYYLRRARRNLYSILDLATETTVRNPRKGRV